MATHSRQYSAEFKAKLVLEVISGAKTPSEVCCSHKLNATLSHYGQWSELGNVISMSAMIGACIPDLFRLETRSSARRIGHR